MLKIFICEDYTVQQNSIKRYVDNFLVKGKGKYDMEMALVTGDPAEIIEYIKTNEVTGLYFLDFNMWSIIDGMMLATRIREYDPEGFIVFITIRIDVTSVIFTHPIDAMDVIVKDDIVNMQERIEECAINANRTYAIRDKKQQDIFTYKKFGFMRSVKTWDIVCFEALKEVDKVALHTVDGVNEFYSSLKKVGKSLKGNFIKCHQSYIINIEHLKRYDKENKEVLMDIGMTVPVSTRNNRKMQNISQYIHNLPWTMRIP